MFRKKSEIIFKFLTKNIGRQTVYQPINQWQKCAKIKYDESLHYFRGKYIKKIA